MTKIVPLLSDPIVIHRSSSLLCSSSNMEIARGSRKIVAALWKLTLCFRRFCSAFVVSHSKLYCNGKTPPSRRISSATIRTSNPSLGLFPRESRRRIFHQIGFSSGQLFFLPVMHRNRVRSGRKIIPQIFHKLQFFRRRQVEYRGIVLVQLKPSRNDAQAILFSSIPHG
jgi:hypothetical protein